MKTGDWLGLFKEHISTKPTRVAWLWMGLVIFVAVGGLGDFGRFFSEIIHIHQGKITDSPSCAELISLKNSALPPLIQALKTFAWSNVASFFCLFFLDQHYANKTSSVHGRERFLAESVHSCGIQNVFRPLPDLDISRQDYASKIRDEVAVSSTLRLLTIAGYEYVGKGSDSLLFEIIKRRGNTLDSEFVLLDDVNGTSVIDERVKFLRERDPTYTNIKLSRAISDTISTLAQLKNSGSSIKAYKSKNHPGFRVLLLDKVIFVSAYSIRKHGHESSLFLISRDCQDSWAPAFEAYYNQVKDIAQEITL